MTNHPNRPKTPAKVEIAVLVTTANKGVFFGYTMDPLAENISLRAARNCLYWPAENKGFVGLAMMGPVSGARVGPAADMPSLRNITSVVKCTEQAVKAWELAPWNR